MERAQYKSSGADREAEVAFGEKMGWNLQNLLSGWKLHTGWRWVGQGFLAYIIEVMWWKSQDWNERY